MLHRLNRIQSAEASYSVIHRIRQSIKDLNGSVARWYTKTCNHPFAASRIFFSFSLLGATAVKQRNTKAALGRSKNQPSNDEDSKELPFDWKEFFKLLKPDLWLLILAVMVNKIYVKTYYSYEV